MLAVVVTVLIAAAAVLSWLGRLASLLRRLDQKAVNRGRLDYYQ